MLQDTIADEQEARLSARATSSCFACGPDNPRGLRLQFVANEQGEMLADWTPDVSVEGFKGIVHGGLVSTVLDEAMAKVVAAAGAEALTAELRVRFRRYVPSGAATRIRGWIEDRGKRIIKTEAVLTDEAGAELAHAWGIFLQLK